MSALAQANILEFIASKGKVALPDIYGQFELVGKRVVDDALLALQERRELIRGGDARQIVYAPARARRGGQSDADYTVIRAKAKELMALSAKHQVRRVDLVKALPDIDAKAIDAWIYQEGRAGRLVRVQLGVYRDGNPPPVTTRDRIEAVFREKKRRTRAEVYAELADLNLHSVSTTLSEVIAQGRVRAMDNMLTWVGDPLTQPGAIKRGGGRKPSNIALVQRALATGPKQRDYLLAVMNGTKTGVAIDDMLQYGIIVEDEISGGYKLPATHTRSDDTEREASAEVTADEPEAVATPARAGDAPAESATAETPEPAMGPAQAVVNEQMTTHAEPCEEVSMSEDPAPYVSVNGTAPADNVPANQVQVGGEHYKHKAIQPWDYIAANGLGFFEGNVVKYVTRWRDKAGLEDLRKARHYLDKLIEVEAGATPE